MPFKLFLVCSLVLIGRPQDVFSLLQAVRPALLFTALALGALLFADQDKRLSAAIFLPESKRFLFLFLIMIAGVPFAVHKGLAFGAVFQSYLPNVLFFLLLLAHLDSVSRVQRFLWVMCMATVLYSLLGGLLHGASGGRFQALGNALDPNDTAFVLLSLFPLCLYSLRYGEGVMQRLTAVLAVFSSIAVILQTGSRGGIIGFAAMLLVMLLTRAGGIRMSHKLLFVILLATTAFIFRDKIDIDRYMTLKDLSSDYNVSADGGRLELWKSAIDLALANPILGVGAECFAFAHFTARQNAGEEFLRWQYTHNSYLQFASEIGLIGFALFFAILVRSLLSFANLGKRGFRDLDATDGERARAMCGFMLLGYVGMLVSGFFLSQAYSIMFTLYFGLAAATMRIERATKSKKEAARLGNNAAGQELPLRPDPA